MLSPYIDAELLAASLDRVALGMMSINQRSLACWRSSYGRIACPGQEEGSHAHLPSRGNRLVSYEPERGERLSLCLSINEEREMMYNVLIEQTKEDSLGKPIRETYSAPQILVFGDVMTLARGSGSGDSDGCSSGHYDD